jgi:hypothetical protein
VEKTVIDFNMYYLIIIIQKIVSNFDLASFNFSSGGSNNLKDTNKLVTNLNNSLNINSVDFFSDFGFVNKVEIFLQNQNSVGKKTDNYKSSPKVNLKILIISPAQFHF